MPRPHHLSRRLTHSLRFRVLLVMPLVGASALETSHYHNHRVSSADCTVCLQSGHHPAAISNLQILTLYCRHTLTVEHTNQQPAFSQPSQISIRAPPHNSHT